MTIADIRFITLTKWQWFNPFYKPKCPSCGTRMKLKIPKVVYNCKQCDCIIFIKE